MGEEQSTEEQTQVDPFHDSKNVFENSKNGLDANDDLFSQSCKTGKEEKSNYRGLDHLPESDVPSDTGSILSKQALGLDNTSTEDILVEQTSNQECEKSALQNDNAGDPVVTDEKKKKKDKKKKKKENTDKTKK